MTMQQLNKSIENSQLEGSTSHFKLGIETLKRQPSDAEKTILISYSASNQKLVAEGREQALKAGNSLEHLTHGSQSSINNQTGTVGPKGRTSMSMDKTPGVASKLKWNISDMTIPEATKSLVSKMRIPGMDPRMAQIFQPHKTRQLDERSPLSNNKKPSMLARMPTIFQQ